MDNLKIITATEARNNWFEVLHWINSEKKEVWIRRNKTIIAKISPGDTPMIGDIEEVIRRTKGMLAGKKTYFPYENPKIQAKERKANNPNTIWKTK